MEVSLAALGDRDLPCFRRIAFCSRWYAIAGISNMPP
jgi:hypothetical protein